MTSLVRPATSADLPAIVALERATPKAPHWPETDYAAALTSEPVKRCLLVATLNATLIGFAAARALDTEAELESIAVALNYRRKRAGADLCQAVMHWCRQQGATILQLEVRAASLGPQRLYTSLGFVVTGRRPGYYRDPDDDAILMRCPLGNASLKNQTAKV